jgi:hypothetical protein
VPELGSHGSVRGARGNSRPYRENSGRGVKPTRLTLNGLAATSAVPDCQDCAFSNYMRAFFPTKTGGS